MHTINLNTLNTRFKNLAPFVGYQLYPFHFSLGLIAVYNQKIAIVHTNWNVIRLPSETPKINETYHDTLTRLAKEELGVTSFDVVHFVGATNTRFLREVSKDLPLEPHTPIVKLSDSKLDYIEVSKTTAWFLAKVYKVNESLIDKNDVKEVIWASFDKALTLLMAEEVKLLVKVRRFIEGI